MTVSRKVKKQFNSIVEQLYGMDFRPEKFQAAFSNIVEPSNDHETAVKDMASDFFLYFLDYSAQMEHASKSCVVACKNELELVSSFMRFMNIEPSDEFISRAYSISLSKGNDEAAKAFAGRDPTEAEIRRGFDRALDRQGFSDVSSYIKLHGVPKGTIQRKLDACAAEELMWHTEYYSDERRYACLQLFPLASDAVTGMTLKSVLDRIDDSSTQSKYLANLDEVLDFSFSHNEARTIGDYLLKNADINDDSLPWEKVSFSHGAVQKKYWLTAMGDKDVEAFNEIEALTGQKMNMYTAVGAVRELEARKSNKVYRDSDLGSRQAVVRDYMGSRYDTAESVPYPLLAIAHFVSHLKGK